MAETKSLSEKLKNVGLILFGAIIVVVCLVLYRFNIYIFTVFLCLYVGVYAIIIIIYLYKKVNDGNPEFNILINVSLYTVCLILSVAMFSVFLLNSNVQQRYSSL